MQARWVALTDTYKLLSKEDKNFAEIVKLRDRNPFVTG